MKLNFNNLSLSQESVLAQSSGAVQGLTLIQLRGWWNSLSQDQKKEVCMIDSSDIIRDLTEAANNALVLCRLKENYKKKGLMSSQRVQSEEGDVQTFTFDLNDKEVLDNDLAQLFSCFQIRIIRNKKPREGPSEGENKSRSLLKSHVRVNEEILDSILDILSQAIFNFGEGDKLLVRDENLFEFYSFLTYNSFQNIGSDTSLHPYLKKLFERLADLAFLLEHKIYLAYAERKISQQKPTASENKEALSENVANQLNNLSVLMNGFENGLGKDSAPALAKTVSQLERECQKPEESEGQNSTASVSPANPIISEPTQNLNFQELSQRLFQNFPTDKSPVFKSKAPYALDKHKMGLQEDSLYSNNQNSSPIEFYYEGFITGNLEITFDASDALLIENDSIASDEENNQDSNEERSESGSSENGKTHKTPRVDLEFYNQRVQNQSQPLTADYSPYYATPHQIMTSHSSPYTRYQNQANRVEFYTPYQTQQGHAIRPNNYGGPITYMGQRNAMGLPSSGYDSFRYQNENPSYASSDNRTPRKESFESQSSYGSESFYSSGKDKLRYPKKPTLPPRFQKMKENMYRN